MGFFLFLVLVNDSGFMGQINNVGELITARKKIKDLKFVDDLTIAESVDMSTQLRVSSQDKPYINKELKILSKQKQREYLKKGKTKKYDVRNILNLRDGLYQQRKMLEPERNLASILSHSQ